MALGDVTLYDDAVSTFPGSKKYAVNVGPVINSGELVLATLSSRYVTQWTAGNSAKPSVGTDYVAGLAMSTSNNTTTATGTIDIMPLIPGTTYLITPNSLTAWDTQAEYNALVGARVKLNTTSGGAQTILATNLSSGGLVVEPLDVVRYPGKVRFSIVQRLSPTN